MYPFSAPALFWVSKALESAKGDCLVASAIVTPQGEAGFYPAQDLDDRAKDKAKEALVQAEKQFRRLGLRISADTTKELLGEIDDETRKNFQWLMERIRGLQRLAEREMSGPAFFYVPAERTKFFATAEAPYIFSEAVAKAFPSASFDIMEAGTCLAFARASACVFHLMRVLEIGLRVLGAKFGISLAYTNWAPAIEQIENRIREMHRDPAWKSLPDRKEQQEFYAQVASHFAILKDAWRNFTMHERGKYTEQEAEGIFQNVKGFMQKLAERLAAE